MKVRNWEINEFMEYLAQTMASNWKDLARVINLIWFWCQNYSVSCNLKSNSTRYTRFRYKSNSNSLETKKSRIEIDFIDWNFCTAAQSHQNISSYKLKTNNNNSFTKSQFHSKQLEIMIYECMNWAISTHIILAHAVTNNSNPGVLFYNCFATPSERMTPEMFIHSRR